MKMGLTILGTMLVLTGIVWSLQGLNLLGGSFMAGQTRWLVIGIVAFVAGVVVLLGARRSRRR
jgi:uncharacterized membrane protein HdeD (DUF308 family)